MSLEPLEEELAEEKTKQEESRKAGGLGTRGSSLGRREECA